MLALLPVPCPRIILYVMVRLTGHRRLDELQLPYPRAVDGASGMECWDWTLADPWPRA